MLMLVAGLSFASCSDDDEGTSIPNDLVGTWEVTASHYAEYKNGSMIYENTNGEVGAVWKLDANGSITGGYIANGTWGVSGNQFLVTTTEDGEKYTEHFTLTRNGNDEVTIKSDITYNEDGSTWREVYELTLTRQGTSGGNGGGNGDIPTTDPGTAGVTVSSNDIVGSWKIVDGYDAAYVNGSLVDSERWNSSDGIGSIFTLKSDGTFTTSDYESGTWRLNGSTLTLTYNDEDDEPVNITIASYSNSQIKWHIHYYDSDGGISYHGISTAILQRS